MKKCFIYDDEDIKLLKYVDSVVEALLECQPSDTEYVERFEDISTAMLDTNDWKIGGKFMFIDHNIHKDVRLNFCFRFDENREYGREVNYVCISDTYVSSPDEYYDTDYEFCNKRPDHLAEDIIAEIDYILSNYNVYPENIKVLNTIKSKLQSI